MKKIKKSKALGHSKTQKVYKRHSKTKTEENQRKSAKKQEKEEAKEESEKESWRSHEDFSSWYKSPHKTKE